VYINNKLFLSFNFLIGWQLSIWKCCKPLFSLLYECNFQILCFRRLSLSVVVEVYPRPFFRILLLQGCLIQTRYAKWYALSINGVGCLKFLKVIFLFSPFEKFNLSLFYPSILFLTFFSSTMFQINLRLLHFFLLSMFLIYKEQHSKYNCL